MSSQVYSESADITCGQARASKWQKLKKKKKSTICLPADDDSLNHHVVRTNYITYCQFHYDLLEHPSPIGHGWEILNGKCRSVHYTLPTLPLQLTHRDWSEDSNESSSDDETSECGESTDSDDE